MIDLNNIFVHGRYILDNHLHLFNSCSGVEFNAECKKVLVKMKTISNQQDKAWMKIIIDNDYDNLLDLRSDTSIKEYEIFSKKSEEEHNFKILKASEAIESYVDIIDITIDGNYLDKPIYDKTFLVYGDSTVSAFGNLGSLGEEKTLFDTDGLNSFSFLACKAFNASMNSVNGSGWGLLFSPWTTPKRRPLLDLFDKVAPLSNEKFDLKLINPTLAIISIGVNDSFYIALDRDNKSKEELVSEFKNGYQKLLQLIKKEFGNIPIVMVYGVMRERSNYNLMHEIYLENMNNFNLHEALLEGDGLGITAHPSINSHKEMSLKLIDLIKVILNE